jgi:hypothetical protein
MGTSIHPVARAVWARTTLHVWPEAYVLASLPLEARPEASGLVGRTHGFVALLVERDEVSLTVAEEVWRGDPLRSRARAEAGPYRAITFDIDIDLGVVGYLAPAAARLAEAAVSIVPQCAYAKDHLLVRAADLATAVAVLHGLIEECRAETAAGAGPGSAR